MAKKKSLDETTENVGLTQDEAIKKLSEDLIKKYGDGIIISASDIMDKPKKCLPISPSIDLAVGGGILEGSWCGLAGPPGCGKAQDLNAIVYTPNGPIKMRDVKVGQLVCTPSGDVAKVLGVFPQGIKGLYEITFSDGSKTKCCDEHLWKVETRNGYKSGVLSTNHLRKRLKMKDGKRIYSISTTSPVQFNENHHYIHPYLMGILLSKGNLDSSLTITTADSEVLDKVSSLVPYGYSVKPSGKTNHKYDYSITRIRDNNHFSLKIPLITNEIKRLGLRGKLSYDKFVPDEYLIDSLNNRISLLQGLMDGDGTVAKDGMACSYSTSSKTLAENVRFLVQSLGGKCTIGEKHPTYTYKDKKLNGRLAYVCHIAINNMSQLFSLEREKNKIKEKTKYFTKRLIESIEYKGKEECQCILIDHPEHLYLTDEFIVTHNTSVSLTIAKNGQKEGRPVFYLNVEARLKTMNLMGIKGLDIPSMNVINYVDNQNLAGEDFLQIAENIISNIKNAIIIIDSVSSLCPTSEMTVDVTGSIRPTTPKMLSHFIRKNTGKVYINNIMVLMIHHVITNTSGYGAKWQISDGVKVNFQADIRLQAKGSPTDWMEGETQVGQIVEWEIAKASNAAAIGSAKSYIRYGIGIDNAAETFNLCCDYGLIKKAGAWFSCPLFTEPDAEKVFQTQGQEKFLKYLNDNEEQLKKLELALKSLI